MKKKKIEEINSASFFDNLIGFSGSGLIKSERGIFTTSYLKGDEVITTARFPMLLFCINISASSDSVLLLIEKKGIRSISGSIPSGISLSNGDSTNATVYLYVVEDILHIRNARSSGTTFRSFGLCLQ